MHSIHSGHPQDISWGCAGSSRADLLTSRSGDGNFVIGIPNAFRANHDDDDGDGAYAKKQDEDYKEMVKQQEH